MESNIDFVEFISVLIMGQTLLSMPPHTSHSRGWDCLRQLLSCVTWETIVKGRNPTQELFSWMFHMSLMIFGSNGNLT